MSARHISENFHKDIARSIMENMSDDEDDDLQDDFNEISHPVDTMVAPSTMTSTSTIQGLGRISLPVGAIDGDADSTDDLMDQSSTGEWETVIDPHLYVLTEWNRNPYERREQDQKYSIFRQQRKRRNSGTGPSLSIVNPLDVLRQRLLLEIARRRMRQSHNQIIANEEILRKIGRR